MSARIAGDRVVLSVTGTEPQVVTVNLKGELLTTIGRAGRGPGEYRDVGSIGVIGDSLIQVFDRRNAVLTTFDLEGQLKQTLALRERYGSGIRPLMATAVQDTLWQVMEERVSEAGHVRPAVEIRVTDGGSAAATLDLQGDEQFIERRGPAYRVMHVPFGRRLWVWLAQGSVAVVESDAAEVRHYDALLHLRRVTRILEIPKRLGRADLSRHVDSILAEYTDPVVRTATAKSVRRRHIHVAAPIVRSFVLGSTGEEWWRFDSPGNSDNIPFHIVSPSGEYACTNSIPADATVLDAAPGVVVISRRLATDEFRIELLTRVNAG